MAYLVDTHYSHGTRIPQYWQPDNAPHVMPCGSQEEAEALEFDLDCEVNNNRPGWSDHFNNDREAGCEIERD